MELFIELSLLELQQHPHSTNHTIINIISIITKIIYNIIFAKYFLIFVYSLDPIISIKASWYLFKGLPSKFNSVENVSLYLSKKFFCVLWHLLSMSSIEIKFLRLKGNLGFKNVFVFLFR